LEVPEHATSEEIKKAFRRLTIKHHPDRKTDSTGDDHSFIKIKRAYEVLIDVSKRNTYDLYGEEGLSEIEKKPKPKGGDYRPEMPVPLSKFYLGGPMTFSFRRGEICRRCKGTGDEGG
jgi:DnaJ-class molecular chaperone